MSNKECDIVQDLLPLYYDNACSEESRRFVEKHLPGCNDCQKMYNELKENNVDEVLAKESKGVLERHAKIERNAAYKAGVVIAAILLLPIVITFIVQLATGMGLGVFSGIPAVVRNLIRHLLPVGIQYYNLCRVRQAQAVCNSFHRHLYHFIGALHGQRIGYRNGHRPAVVASEAKQGRHT